MTHNSLRPFFCYYGGKWRAAPHYPTPQYNSICEPFAGAAGYSLRYPDLNVTLVDRDPKIVGLWRYLTRVTESEIRSLPATVEHTVDVLPICEEAKWLIGFWLNKGSAQPCKTPSAWMRGGTRPNSYWGETVRGTLANQVRCIRHWKIVEGSYAYCLQNEQTWFVDPPYQKAGKHYKHGANAINFARLGEWCKSLPGQVMVCENEGADWLPFRFFKAIKATESKTGGKVSKEVIWENTP